MAHESMSRRHQESGVTLRGKRAAVLLFSHYPFDPRPRRAAEALVNEGMQVELICLRQSSDEPTRETFNGVDILRLPITRRRGGLVAYLYQYSAFVMCTFWIMALRSLTRRFALVHVHNMPDVLVWSALVPKVRGAKVILDLHDPMPELMMTIFGLDPSSYAVRLLKRIERWSIGFADLVLTVNVACREIFTSRGCAPEKIDVVMNSPDEEIFAFRPMMPSSPDRTGPFVIMYHGSLVERNGLDVAVEALGILRGTVPGAVLRVYGDRTPFLDTVMQTVRERGLDAAVQYRGGKTLEQIRVAIDECDVGVIPNRRTTFTEINTPTRIFEYLSRGRPVITGRARGVQDYFDEDSLLFFELGDATDLARCLASVHSNHEGTERVIERGQEVYLAHRWSEERRRLIGRSARLVAPSTPRPTPVKAGARG
jgi:glycosyltransferase involved in cell wall biosynthesis